MENQDRFSTFDRALLAICLIVVLLCSFLMIDGRFLFSGDDTSKLTAIGEINYSENDVRQKHQTGFRWRGAHQEDKVFEGDSIFTGNSSKAKVKLAGGGELEIDPKSLVVIRTRDGKLELDLLYGAFSGNLAKGEKLTVIKDGERTELIGDGLPLKIADTDIKKPAAQKLVKGINLDLPANDILYWNGPINYSWSDNQESANYIVEFSGGPTFKKKIANFDVSEKQFSAKPDFQLVQKGNRKEFFWRVRSKDKSNLVSEVRKVTIYKDLPPILATPIHQHVHFIESEKPETQVIELSWSEPSLSQDYNVQVAKDEGFNEVLVTQSTVNKRFETSSLSRGEYYWRVQGNHPSRSNSPWSEVRKFTVLDNGSVTTPKLASSERIYVLPLNKVLKQPSNKKFENLGVPITDYPVYKWSPVLGASGYALEVSKDRTFKTFATQDVLPTSSEFKFIVMKPGVMAWRVRTKFISGTPSEPSEVSTVKTELPPPPQRTVEQRKDGINASWEPLLFARHYEIQWATDDQFAAPQSVVTNAETYLIQPKAPPQSSLFWRIRALDQQKRPLSAFSEPYVLRAVRKLASNDGADSTITRPVPREPRAYSSVVSFDNAPVFLNFKWTRVPQVENYRFELSTSPEFTDEPLHTAVINGDQLLLSQKIPAGEYYWRVRGENEEGSWTVWSDPAPFVIQFR